MAAALRAEGIRGPNGSAVLVDTDELVQHWYYENPSLTQRCSNASEGFPWSHPANAFAREYSYEFGALPRCVSVIFLRSAELFLSFLRSLSGLRVILRRSLSCGMQSSMDM
jgi:hypothetical protein